MRGNQTYILLSRNAAAAHDACVEDVVLVWKPHTHVRLHERLSIAKAREFSVYAANKRQKVSQTDTFRQSWRTYARSCASPLPGQRP